MVNNIDPRVYLIPVPDPGVGHGSGRHFTGTDRVG